MLEGTNKIVCTKEAIGETTSIVLRNSETLFVGSRHQTISGIFISHIAPMNLFGI
ncbi:hypothetical protein O9929_15815 [Vibrio lentus]|nr:hypothetical protein [Vibrio lentus]